ncbi:hypothetical protein D1872_246480 [compost metagenome]
MKYASIGVQRTLLLFMIQQHHDMPAMHLHHHALCMMMDNLFHDIQHCIMEQIGVLLGVTTHVIQFDADDRIIRMPIRYVIVSSLLNHIGPEGLV